MRHNRLINNKRFKALVKRQRCVVGKYPRSKYMSSLTVEIQNYIQQDLERSKSSFVRNFR